jgi:transcriptional regulator with XRE-family HTH domain
MLRIDKISKSEKGFCNLEKEEKTEENLVKKTCRELGITQKELAETLGVSNTTISDWANNKTPIPSLGLKTLSLLKVEKEFLTFKKIIKDTLLLNNNISRELKYI